MALLALSGCINVDSELARRKDVATGAISNVLPTDTVQQSIDLPGVEAVAGDISDDHTGVDAVAPLDRVDDTPDIDPEVLDVSEVDVCEPQCDGMECGPDMCGGLCGFCPGNDVCTLGQCKSCKADCDFKECGPDGCGDLCGTCPSKFSCVSQVCVAPACTADETIYVEDFGSCSQGDFGILDSNTEDNVTWWALPLQFSSPPCGLYLGDPQTLNYDTGSSIQLELLSPVLDLPPYAALQLTFQLHMLTEILPSPLYPYDHDVLFLFYEQEPAGPVTEVWSSKSNLNTTEGEMLPVAVDLSAQGGSSGRFRFVFDTINSTDNDNPGIYLDDFSVGTICPYCELDEDCDDDDLCTVDSCLLFTNFPDIGTCWSETLEECCLNDPDTFCDDQDPCTEDMCDLETAACLHELVPNCPAPEPQ